jgi:hypothetical protein
MVARLSLLQLFLAFAVATARNDPPPSSERAWAPPKLPNYERDLAAYHSKTAEGGARER